MFVVCKITWVHPDKLWILSWISLGKAVSNMMRTQIFFWRWLLLSPHSAFMILWHWCPGRQSTRDLVAPVVSLQCLANWLTPKNIRKYKLLKIQNLRNDVRACDSLCDWFQGLPPLQQPVTPVSSSSGFLPCPGCLALSRWWGVTTTDSLKEKPRASRLATQFTSRFSEIDCLT